MRKYTEKLIHRPGSHNSGIFLEFAFAAICLPLPVPFFLEPPESPQVKPNMAATLPFRELLPSLSLPLYPFLKRQAEGRLLVA